MSDELTAVEGSITKVLLELMIERVMLERGVSIGIQLSLRRGLLASLSTAHKVGPSHEWWTKHKDDLVNAKLILSILLAYLPPLSGAINRDSVPREFEYELVTTYLSKGIRIVRADQDKLTALKFSDFNLSDKKVYDMIALHKYLTRTKGKNSNIVSQSWTQNLAQSTLLNVMKIPHFGWHQEVNACVKLLFSCYHGGYL